MRIRDGINNFNIIANVLLVVANLLLLIVNVYYVCHWYPILPTEMEIDSMGIIVGILSLLVTALIGWNIYSVIDIKNEKSRIEEKRKEIDNRIDVALAETYSCMSMFYGNKVFEEKTSKDTYIEAYLYFNVLSLRYSASCEKYSNCNLLVNEALNHREAIMDIKINKNIYSNIQGILKGIPNTNHIDRFNELETLIRELNVGQ